MKFIVIGLGYFGGSLATTLTKQGHEVLGVDKRMERVQELKEDITLVMEMDTTNSNAIQTLPLTDVDAVIVAIGEDIGASVLTLALLKNTGVRRIIGRAMSPIHKEILHQIGIEEIIQPEEETALLLASMLPIEKAHRVMELNHEFAVVQIAVPEKYVGHSLAAVNLEDRFNLKLVAVQVHSSKSFFSLFSSDCKVELDIDYERPLRDSDMLVVAGKLLEIKRFAES